MNCTNCGAAMTLHRENQYYHCEYCGSYHFPAASKDGVRLLGPAPDDVRCPQCAEPLLLASLDDKYRGFQCPTCQGLLLENAGFGEVVTARRAWATEAPEPARPLNREHLERRILCPLCHHTMDTHPYAGPGTIVIDTCAACKVIWLDYGELARAVNAPGRDRGSALLREDQLERLTASHDDDDDDDDRREKRRRRRGAIDLTDLLNDLFG